jgi:hypothetical protein
VSKKACLKLSYLTFLYSGDCKKKHLHSSETVYNCRELTKYVEFFDAKSFNCCRSFDLIHLEYFAELQLKVHVSIENVSLQ